MISENRLHPLNEEWDRLLAIVAHPDDMEYGPASAVARWSSQGKEITYLNVTSGEAGIDSMPPEETAPLRKEEERKSARVVGVHSVEFLDHKDGVIEYGLPLRRDIARVIRRHRPQVLLTGNFQLTWQNGSLNMADHRAVGLAVMDAARDAGNRWIFPELIDEGLEPWDGVKMVCVSGTANTTHAVDVTDFIDRGVESLKEHKAYIENLGEDFDPDTFLRMNLNAIGVLYGCDYAVGFEIITI